LQSYDEKKEISAGDVVEMIKKIGSSIDGVTISGGEPFFKPKGLDSLVEQLKSITDDILIFTGYTLEELHSMNMREVDRVLENCSVLIDGAYIEELNEGVGLRGSSNQHIWIFKHHDKYVGIEENPKELQTVVYGNSILTIGIPGKEICDKRIGNNRS
jgi:anaerobic ribonucleoside-triphosphate reductase activating protein